MSRYGAEHIIRWVWSGVAFLVLSVGASFLRPQRVLAQEIADYAFVEVSGVDSVSRQAPFYNSRLQMIDVGEDKFLLAFSDDDKLTLRLFRQAPWHWQALDILTDSLDFSLVFLSQSGGDWVGAIFAVLPLGWVLLQVSQSSRDSENARLPES